MKGTMEELRRSPRDQERWRSAQELLLSGHHEAALPAYQVLARRYPAIAELWFELGNAASGCLDFPLANQAYRRTRELAPGNASLLGMLGHQYQGLRQLDDARACYARAVRIAPDSVDARINLAVWHEKERQIDEAWDCVQECLKRHPRDDQARYFQAFLMHRRKQAEAAESALRDLIADGPRYPYVKYASRHLLGVVLDGMGHHDEAMRWLLEAKQEVRGITDTSALENAYDQQQKQRTELLSHLTTETLARWRDEAPSSGEGPGLAFLGGHPRSGTTLLEQILDAHPDLLAFDEPVAFAQEIARPLEQAPPGKSGFQHLDSLAADQRSRMRQRYVSSLLREAPQPHRAHVLLDKNPSPTLSLCSWLRIFPELKVVIALRDPRDVVISCFFLNIMLNSTNVNFLSLDRTVRHYQDLMGVWLRMRELGGFDWIETRYEDVVSDMAAEGRRTTSFLGLDWNEHQTRYHETSRRKVLYAPTYHDVTQPVYRRAVGRWHLYEKHLEPHQDKLAAFCKAFGYEA